MSTLAEIEKAIPQLTASELAELERVVRLARQDKRVKSGTSIFDMAPLNLGKMLRPLGTRDEWYDEMLEDRL